MHFFVQTNAIYFWIIQSSLRALDKHLSLFYSFYGYNSRLTTWTSNHKTSFFCLSLSLFLCLSLYCSFILSLFSFFFNVPVTLYQFSIIALHSWNSTLFPSLNLFHSRFDFLPFPFPLTLFPQSLLVFLPRFLPPTLPASLQRILK